MKILFRISKFAGKLKGGLSFKKYQAIPHKILNILEDSSYPNQIEKSKFSLNIPVILPESWFKYLWNILMLFAITINIYFLLL